MVKAGQLETVITYLEMTGPPRRPTVPPPPGKLALLRAERPTISFYRYLYNTVGGPWQWWERRVMDDAALGDIITDPAVEIYVLYVDGVPAGFAELDGRANREVEIAYLGLLEDFIGRGLGWYLLNWAVDAAWTREPRRVWVHTCNLDHPRALPTYQRAGFQVYRQETEVIDDPALVLGATALPVSEDKK